LLSVAKPVLWHIKISHFSEKARWALDYKGVEHERRAPPPGAHMAIALAKTRGRSKTFPLLDLDGRTYGDSTEIIAALEERFPEPPLYPAEPDERRRALELEDWFDEEIGPHPRLLGWHEILRDPDATDRLLESGLVGPLRRRGPVLRGATGGFLQLRYGVRSEPAADEARARIRAALDRIESELGDRRDYLVGEGFSVADLTAAAMLYPVVLPPEGPTMPGPPPTGLAEFRESLAERPGFRWVEETFRRHRRRGAAQPAAA
jgi:glutathione S-transferase